MGELWRSPMGRSVGTRLGAPRDVAGAMGAGCMCTATANAPAGHIAAVAVSGSGTTAMVARQLGRKAVGIELNPDYLALSTQRIGDTPFDFGGAA